MDTIDASKLSLKLPVVVALVTGLCTSVISVTGGYFLLRGEIAALATEQVNERDQRIEAVKRVESVAVRSSERVEALSTRVSELTVSVGANISAMKVQQVEDGKKLDILLRMAMDRGTARP